MTDTKPTPQRVQPRSRSAFADPPGTDGPVKPPKKNGFQRAKPKANTSGPKVKPRVEAEGRQRMIPENQLKQLRQAEEAEDAQAEQAAPAPRKSTRIPFGNQVSKMGIPEREGFTRRWFNDKPGRIQRALDAGYKMIENPLTKAPYELTVNQSAGKNDAMKAFAMEIPNEFYDEDFALKQEALDLTDEAIYTGKLNEQKGDKRYVPADLMKFSTKRGPGSHIA